ncbi:MAG: hypothetical protein ACRDLB_14900 [Actinomycetota bacterium]
MRDTVEYIHFADQIEALARELGEHEGDPTVAVERIVSATHGRVLALRRAHRHCEREISQGSPATKGLIRAFFYLSAARIRTEGYIWQTKAFLKTT